MGEALKAADTWAESGEMEQLQKAAELYSQNGKLAQAALCYQELLQHPDH
eukprot:CAMPEP_0178454334 /NCGR_PEP_ID=MMETSP0689_2-20121128/45304_1 /TAXON_ID=160604 /ORGANISM="Amphidinium massartii, Strain CS-259" /LENGTH=49 /DNA_ID= /DNA_START= /DNA_END= /DNA_ORIENTATION=